MPTARCSRPRFSEQDPEDWGQAANQALSDIFTPRPAGLAFTEQMHGPVLLDGPGPIDELLPEVDGIVGAVLIPRSASPPK